MIPRKDSELIGWYGFAAIVGAYAASNLGFLALESFWYQMLNLTGAAALLVDSWPDRNWQIVTLNGIWALVAIIAVIQ